MEKVPLTFILRILPYLGGGEGRLETTYFTLLFDVFYNMCVFKIKY